MVNVQQKQYALRQIHIPWDQPPRLFTQPFIQAQIKENIKAPRQWPLPGEMTGDRLITRT